METVSSKKMKATADQIRAARMLLRLSQQQLAAAAGVALNTLSDFETGKKVPHSATHAKIQEACERRGIVFSNGDKPCVCLDRSIASIPT